MGCLLPPEVAAPVHTYTGWNLRSREAGAENELVGLRGSMIPLPTTNAVRQQTGDPRPSLEQLYGSHKQYLKLLSEKCHQLHDAGYLLEEDVDRSIKLTGQRTASLFDK